jgi:hypothetical protein
MAGLGPAIHGFFPTPGMKVVDARDMRGHDDSTLLHPALKSPG